ncbi:saccharopine dehydrogenase NADP-binding domain-containing protein [Streptomyces bambusae]|uniref:saccharopine dehydrogenase NADP-binding domain-containing protein n=1 Tax=Streptomyces bambusae TaxID=1550616 RepID=UPI001CFC86ED|nr:saccharopine dehydrogenase NADP-binding domain-containing protein [Streptomyces bambusae]MCB5166508.1 saccharopine dehydrogenase NADP-binding domain-containing protein [Streptomyces bambusae]
MAAATQKTATVTVFGAYGHTGRFVVAELRERGFVPVLSGRDADKLAALAAETGFASRPAAVDDPAALDRALAGAAAVINCAGPFAHTAAPVVEAALRAGIPYVDVAAEIEANADTFADFADRAREAGTVVLPAMAFYGALGDLLATAALDGRTTADEAHIAYALSSWHPTEGTRKAGAVSRDRRGGGRVVFTEGRLQYRHDSPATVTWPFPEPVGPKDVIAEFTMADVVTVPSHLDIPEVRTYMTTTAAHDVLSPTSPASPAPDAHSDQTFLIDVLLRTGDEEHRATARGKDIYAVTAPLAVEATARILTGRTHPATGVTSAGRLFDARDFLEALSGHLDVQLPG